MIRWHLRLPAVAALVTCALGCGGEAGSPGAPVLPIPTAPTGSGPMASVRVVNTLTDQPVSGASATGASVRSTSSDGDGLITLEASGPARYAVHVTAAQFVTRQTTVAIPGMPGRDARLDLIPSSFDLVAFDQMFRGVTTGGRLAKWTAAPALVVQRTGLLWANSPNDRYLAEDEQWTDSDIDGVIADLTFGLETISAGVFPAFSAIRIEQAVAGTTVTVPQAGAIVVARYRALRGPSGDRIGGFGKTSIDAAGVIQSGMVMLDRDAELQSASRRRLRVHELGHVLGTSHVTSRLSFMNPDGTGGLPNEADKEAFRVAARRPPGNRSPDLDPLDFTLNAARFAAQRALR